MFFLFRNFTHNFSNLKLFMMKNNCRDYFFFLFNTEKLVFKGPIYYKQYTSKMSILITSKISTALNSFF